MNNKKFFGVDLFLAMMNILDATFKPTLICAYGGQRFTFMWWIMVYQYVVDNGLPICVIFVYLYTCIRCLKLNFLGKLFFVIRLPAIIT